MWSEGWVGPSSLRRLPFFVSLFVLACGALCLSGWLYFLLSVCMGLTRCWSSSLPLLARRFSSLSFCCFCVCVWRGFSLLLLTCILLLKLFDKALYVRMRWPLRDKARKVVKRSEPRDGRFANAAAQVHLRVGVLQGGLDEEPDLGAREVVGGGHVSSEHDGVLQCWELLAVPVQRDEHTGAGVIGPVPGHFQDPTELQNTAKAQATAVDRLPVQLLRVRLPEESREATFPPILCRSLAARDDRL